MYPRQANVPVDTWLSQDGNGSLAVTGIASTVLSGARLDPNGLAGPQRLYSK